MANDKKAQSQTIPPQALIVLGIILIIAAAAIGYFGVYDPAAVELERATSNVITKQNELDDVRQQQVDYQEYRKASERLEKRLGDLKAKIPSTSQELNNFLASISQRARSARVAKWTLYKQEGNISKGEYEAIPIRMEFVASYEAALQFFWDLASMGDGVQNSNREQLINIRDVQIVRDKGVTADSLQTLVKVNCVAETYLYTGNAAAAPNGKKK